jgi:replicative DNA helicase
MAFEKNQSNRNGKWVNYKDLAAQAIPSPIRSLRVPPQNVDAEMALLGSIMLRPLGLNEIMDSVHPDSFYAEKHRIIYQGMLELSRKNEPIDLLSLTSILRDQSQLESVGGPAYLSELVGNVPTSTNIEYYANIVARKATLRNLIGAGDTVAELGYNETDDIEEVLDTAEKTVMGVTSKLGNAKKFESAKDVMPELIEHYIKVFDNKGEIQGVPSGFRDLDRILSGFHKSDLVILAARPAVGKTSIALNIAKNAAVNHKIPVGIFSLEMSAQSLIDRIVSSHSGVDSWKLKTGNNLTEEELQLVIEKAQEISEAPIFIDDQAGNNVLKMRSTARRLKSEHGLGLIIVDYLQLMSPTKNYDSMVNQISEISRSLKQLARELDVPVIALSQLSRAVESRGGEPRLSDLRDSGSIEQDADIVMFIHSEDAYKPKEERTNIKKIIVAKHRNGATGEVELLFDGNKTTFVTIEKNSFDSYAPSASVAPEDDF